MIIEKRIPHTVLQPPTGADFPVVLGIRAALVGKSLYGFRVFKTTELPGIERGRLKGVIDEIQPKLDGVLCVREKSEVLFQVDVIDGRLHLEVKTSHPDAELIVVLVTTADVFEKSRSLNKWFQRKVPV